MGGGRGWRERRNNLGETEIMEGNKETLKILKDYIDKITVRREGKNNKHSEKNEIKIPKRALGN